VIYSLLDQLKESFSEGDVALLVTMLNAVGLALRSEDAAGMKDFVVAVHARAAQQGAEGTLSTSRPVYGVNCASTTLSSMVCRVWTQHVLSAWCARANDLEPCACTFMHDAVIDERSCGL
jgi:hypothetical protein